MLLKKAQLSLNVNNIELWLEFIRIISVDWGLKEDETPFKKITADSHSIGVFF